jgi:hypothetical protein
MQTNENHFSSLLNLNMKIVDHPAKYAKANSCKCDYTFHYYILHVYFFHISFCILRPMFEFKITPHYHMLHVYFFHFAFDENVYTVTP